MCLSKYVIIGKTMMREIRRTENRNNKTIAHFSDRLCIVTSRNAIVVMSQALTNLVFLVRRKDQPLDKSVFIRKEEKPSSIYQPCPAITRSLSPRDLHSYPRTFAIHPGSFL